MYLSCAAGVLVIDLPLSVIGDTLTLPMTERATFERASADKSSDPDAGDKGRFSGENRAPAVDPPDSSTNSGTGQ
jgi:hypothetical protein